MPTITILTFEEMPTLEEAISLLNGKKKGEDWVSARQNKYNQDEIFIQYWYYENIESGLKRALSEEDSYEIVSVLKENGMDRVLKRVYAFVNYLTHTLEIYIGNDAKARKLLSILEENLKIKFTSLRLTEAELLEIYKKHSNELTKVVLRDSLSKEEIAISGGNVDNSEVFGQLFGDSGLGVRAIAFHPRIKFMNQNNRYIVSLDGDRGTLRISSNQIFQWRPRYEIRQIVFIIAATKRMLERKEAAFHEIEEPQRSSPNEVVA
jgi:hypothetical protein